MPHTQMGSGGKIPLILNLGTRWKWMVYFVPQPLYSCKEVPCHPLNRQLGGPQSQSRLFGKETDLLSLLKTEPHFLSFQQPSQYTDW